MPRIKYNMYNFPRRYQSLNGQGILDISWAELVWAAISVGKGELFHILRYGRFSMFEIAYRLAILYANLCENEQEYIRRSLAYDGLDPSEKGAISYFLGLTFAKVFGERLLNVPWLMHLDVYRDILGVSLINQSRPDLVGRNVDGEWVVMESKGRTNGFDSGALEQAKRQAEQVIEISGEAPVLRIGLEIHFSDGTLHIVAVDPEFDDSSEQRIELPLTKEQFFKGYYRPFKTWIKDAPDATHFEWRGTNYKMVTIKSVDVSIALVEDVLENDKLFFLGEPSKEGQIFAAPDGLLVQIGSAWSRDNMKKEPQERQ